MERDLMGMNAEESVVVKEEHVEENCKGSGVPPSSSNEAVTLPNLMSLKPEQDDKPMKMKSGSDIFEAIYKQEADNVEKFDDAATKQQCPCGDPFATPHLAGTTKLWMNSVPPIVPSQLTIFYGGTVCVFNHIAPEKAQTIIFMAGNECIPSNMARSKLSAADWLMANQSMPPGTDIWNPMCDSSHLINQSGVRTDVKASKIADINNAEVPCLISSLGHMISSVVPQARRASLARFLEKRKERVKNAAPYQKTPSSNSSGFSATSPDSSNSSGSTSKDCY